MANEVFVNGLEVACKAADGVSSAAFPDPCMVSPCPATPVIVPFPNTAYAKDTTKGSKTVFISGKEVMLKDKSYFKTSTGNEAAKCKKGMITGTKKGKAYFRSWSMNVKIEGYNVCRHTDSMTHNHGSQPGNTGVWKYWDTGWFTAPCQDELEKVERACGGQKEKKEKDFFGKGTHKVWKDNKSYKSGGWKKKHCRFLEYYPKDLNTKVLEDPKLLGDLKDKLADATNVAKIAQEASSVAMGLATKQLIKLGVKMVATKFVPGIGWIYSIVTAADDIADIKYYTAMYNGAVAEYERITSNIKDIGKDLTDIMSGDKEAVTKTVANWQRNVATLDPCLRARKCMLVPYDETPSQKKDKKNKTDEGCCNGQTGHHLIPDKFVDKSGCKDSKGKAYSKKGAPTVCAEGTSHSLGGSHESLHTTTNEMLVPADKMTKVGSDYPVTKTSYDDVRDGVIKAHAKTFPFSACSQDCLKAQLDKYYKDCNDLSVKRMGKDPAKEPSSGTSGR